MADDAPHSSPARPSPGALAVVPLAGVPEVRPGDDLAALLWDALLAGPGLDPGDVVAVSSKVVSKAAGLSRAATVDRQGLVLRESRRVVAERATATGVTRVVEALAGPVMVGAGIDGSNTGADDVLLLLPHDPDAAAADLRAALAARAGHDGFAVVVTDTAGRAWRAGQTDFALGSAGLVALDDLRGSTDADGRPLAVTARAVADEVAAAADLVKGKASGVPAALLRGLPAAVGDGPGARALVRTGPTDWFALGAVEAVRAALGIEPGSALSAQVGLAPAGGDDARERLERCVRAALDPVGLAAQLAWDDDDSATVHVTAAPEVCGYAAARLEVAAAAEGLTAELLGGWAVRLS